MDEWMALVTFGLLLRLKCYGQLSKYHSTTFFCVYVEDFQEVR